jgi:hypothetical protein
MNFFQRRAILKKANHLDLTPIRMVTEEIDDANMVTVLIPKFTSKLGKKLITPSLKAPYIRLKLDLFGSATWLAIDGQKKVGAIAQLLLEKFGDKIQPVEDRLTKFLALLYEQRLVSYEEIRKK